MQPYVYVYYFCTKVLSYFRTFRKYFILNMISKLIRRQVLPSYFRTKYESTSVQFYFRTTFVRRCNRMHMIRDHTFYDYSTRSATYSSVLKYESTFVVHILQYHKLLLPSRYLRRQNTHVHMHAQFTSSYLRTFVLQNARQLDDHPSGSCCVRAKPQLPSSPKQENLYCKKNTLN